MPKMKCGHDEPLLQFMDTPDCWECAVAATDGSDRCADMECGHARADHSGGTVNDDYEKQCYGSHNCVCGPFVEAK